MFSPERKKQMQLQKTAPCARWQHREITPTGYRRCTVHLMLACGGSADRIGFVALKTPGKERAK
jgi:hypothetical protein